MDERRQGWETRARRTKVPIRTRDDVDGHAVVAITWRLRSPSVDDVLERRTFLAGVVAAVAAACSSARRSVARSPSGTSGASTPPSTSSASPSTQAKPTAFVSSGPRDRQQIALTFHVNGDPALATRLLDLLRGDRVPITAFMVGNWLDPNHDLATRFVTDGHEVANHTFTHPTFPTLDRNAMTNEVVGCRNAISRLTGNGGRFFRPSGTANGTDSPAPVVLDVAGGAGYATVVGYDVDPADYQDPGAATVSRRTLTAVRPGSIVSLHFGHPGTIDALPSILAGLQARGLTPVTMSALLA
jgi:peptidoglycan/xylan/chitin deacetylase (PgdA/CDA1 family)